MSKGIWASVAVAATVGAMLWSNEAAADGLYVGAYGGVVFLHDADAELEISGVGAAGFDLVHNPGFVVGTELGYSFGNGLRLAGEFAFRHNSQDSLDLGFAALDAEGETQSVALMANLYYDIATGTPITPYIGAGLGGALMTLSIDELGGLPLGYDDSDFVFAYQAMAWVGYAITERVSAGLEYRFFGTTDPSFSDQLGGVIGLGIDTQYFSHNMLMTLRYRFD